MGKAAMTSFGFGALGKSKFGGFKAGFGKKKSAAD
jgi:hypothetical protein